MAGNPLSAYRPRPQRRPDVRRHQHHVAHRTGNAGARRHHPAGRTAASTPTPARPTPSAADANGDYVVAWTDTTAGPSRRVGQDVPADRRPLNADGSRATSVGRVCGHQPGHRLALGQQRDPHFHQPHATDISVARDTDGDFVVTWSDWNATHQLGRVRRAVQRRRPGAVGGIFRVNTYTADVQRYSSVAMDAEGDFVITWQSNEPGRRAATASMPRRTTPPARSSAAPTRSRRSTSPTGSPARSSIRWDDDNNPATPDKVASRSRIRATPRPSLAAVQSRVGRRSAPTSTSWPTA